MSATVQYPRALMQLHARVLGEDLVATVTPMRLTIERRNHSEASSIEVEFPGNALPFDPRHVEDLWVGVYFGDVRSMDGNVHQPQFLRFMGYADNIEASREVDDAPSVKLEARDFSAQLRAFKPIPTAMRPRYSDTLQQALQRILDGVPSASGLLSLPGLGLHLPLSPLVSGRGRTGTLPLANDASAWDAIERACGAVNRLVSVELDRLVVREPTGDNQTRSDVVFNYGGPAANSIKVRQKKRFERNRRSVVVHSFDPRSRRRLSAEWPAPAAAPRRTRARGQQGRGGGRNGDEQRDIYALRDGITSQDELLRSAERIYTNRSRQELAIDLESPLLTEEFLSIHNGDRVMIRVEPGLEANIRAANATSPQAAVALIRRRIGCSAQAAEILARAVNEPTTALFYVRGATFTYELEGAAMVKIDAANLILETLT